jgi:hypothetical protein
MDQYSNKIEFLFLKNNTQKPAYLVKLDEWSLNHLDNYGHDSPDDWEIS